MKPVNNNFLKQQDLEDRRHEKLWIRILSLNIYEDSGTISKKSKIFSVFETTVIRHFMLSEIYFE